MAELARGRPPGGRPHPEVGQHGAGRVPDGPEQGLHQGPGIGGFLENIVKNLFIFLDFFTALPTRR